MMRYKVLLYEGTYRKVKAYFNDWLHANRKMGLYLQKKLNALESSQLSCDEFLEHLVNTKLPRIFVESEVYGDGKDWSQTELAILGDVGIAVPVTVYDNGLHDDPVVHANPFRATLLYIPGALLQNDTGNTPADWNEVVIGNELNVEAYYALYERRLLPSFIYADNAARSRKKQAFVTIPGLGCGLFAGRFHGMLGMELRNVLIKFLTRYSDRFEHIRAVYYDPYRECQNERFEIGQLSFFVRPLTHGNYDKPQLCEPSTYEDNDDDFAHCELFSFVAWDHVSWPGNDFYVGSRVTDDGVKAAATDSMAALTDVKGSYNERDNRYDPPAPYVNWLHAAQENGCKIRVVNNLAILV